MIRPGIKFLTLVSIFLAGSASAGYEETLPEHQALCPEEVLLLSEAQAQAVLEATQATPILKKLEPLGAAQVAALKARQDEILKAARKAFDKIRGMEGILPQKILGREEATETQLLPD